MRGSVAKALRRAAKHLTVGIANREYILKSRMSNTICLDPMCTRAVYQQLKRVMKRLNHE